MKYMKIIEQVRDSGYTDIQEAIYALDDDEVLDELGLIDDRETVVEAQGFLYAWLEDGLTLDRAITMQKALIERFERMQGIRK